MTIERKLLGTTPVSGEVPPEGVSFDGTNDYLKRTSDMTGNADGKTFTLSFWVYPSGAGVHRVISFGGNRLYFTVSANGEYGAGAQNSSGSNIFVMAATSGYPYVAFNTWNHVLLSINLANSSERHLYINDGNIPPQWQTYTNQNIDFTNSEMGVGAYTLGSAAYKTKAGRLAHVFLDYTYRDLSTTSNRRLFIDADGKPADSDTLAALNPIMYMPLIDAATAGSNSGTGGDFTVNGVLATAQRGPNQDNCSASTLDGTGDYLSRSLMSGASDSKTFTYAGVVRTATTGNNSFFELYNTSTSAISYMTVSSVLTVVMEDASGQILSFTYSNVIKEQSLALAFSLDLTDVNKRHVIINGVDVTSSVTFSNYTNRTIPFSTYPVRIGGDTAAFGYYTGSVGETYFDTTYTDLSADNPFWDSTANRPNSVRKVIADTGVTPLVALPIMGNDAGNNLGSGGDFSVQSGPYVGARGGSEFWARSASVASDAGYLSGSISPSAGKVITGMVCYRGDNSNISYPITCSSGSVNEFVEIKTRAGVNASTYVISIKAKNSSGTIILSSTTTVTGNSLDTTKFDLILFSIDLNNSANRYIHIEGFTASTSWATYTNDTIPLNDASNTILFGTSSGGNFGGGLGSIYFDDSYIDFSQEANRNKFISQLSYPIDLTQQIEDGDIPNPLIYMKFDDKAALGTNSGTAGNFTVNGTVTAGADVTP